MKIMFIEGEVSPLKLIPIVTPNLKDTLRPVLKYKLSEPQTSPAVGPALQLCDPCDRPSGWGGGLACPDKTGPPEHSAPPDTASPVTTQPSLF